MTFYEELENDIRKAYEENISTEEAERLAAKFLLAQLEAGRELASLDLDARMKKTGTKEVKAQVYLQHVRANDKKPSDVMLQALVDSDQIVVAQQSSFDTAEVERDRIQNYLNVFRDAHIFYRSVAKGKFE